MSNSWNISNAEFVPDLELFDYEEASLRKALAVKIKEGTTSTVEGIYPKDWCGGGDTAHGGFIVSFIQAAAREYFQVRHPSKSQPDAIHIQIQFLTFITSGPIIFNMKDLKLGRRLSVIQVEVQSPDDDGNIATRIVANVTQGNLAGEKGLTGTLPTKLTDMPQRENCVRWGEEWWMNTIPMTRKLRHWVPTGGPDVRWKDRFGPGIRESWSKMDDNSGFEILSLGYLLDPLLSVPTDFSSGGLVSYEACADYMYPTVAMSVEIKRDPRGAEWLFTRIQCRKVEKGRYGIDVTIANEEGEVVAISRYMSLNAPRVMGNL